MKRGLHMCEEDKKTKRSKMFRFSLVRVNLSWSLVEFAIADISTDVNHSRSLLGFSWGRTGGLSLGFLYLIKWGLALSSGARFVDFRIESKDLEPNFWNRLGFSLVP